MILRVDKRKKVNCPFQIILSPLSTIPWGKTSIMQPFLQKQISLTWDDSSSNHLQSDNKFFQLKTISAEAKRGRMLQARASGKTRNATAQQSGHF